MARPSVATDRGAVGTLINVLLAVDTFETSEIIVGVDGALSAQARIVSNTIHTRSAISTRVTETFIDLHTAVASCVAFGTTTGVRIYAVVTPLVQCTVMSNTVINVIFAICPAET